MKIFYTPQEWRAFRNTQISSNTLGFVPTMGNLHPGHLSLMARSLAENNQTIASIFINPKQFNQSTDYMNYPRTLANDLEQLEKMGINYCLIPQEHEMYSDNYRFQVHENQQSLFMEGAHRPGHFTGVLTVVLKLLNLVQADHAYFGEKDFQQYLLIKDMAAAFFLQTTIHSCPTIREPSGLAYSSRNNRLSVTQKNQAEHFAQIFQQNKPCQTIIEELTAAGIEVEYVNEQDNRRYAAVKIDDVRLIDNYVF